VTKVIIDEVMNALEPGSAGASASAPAASGTPASGAPSGGPDKAAAIVKIIQGVCC